MSDEIRKMEFSGNIVYYSVHNDEARMPLGRFTALVNHLAHLERKVMNQGKELCKLNKMFRSQASHVHYLESLSRKLYEELMHVSAPSTQGELTAEMQRAGLIDLDIND